MSEIPEMPGVSQTPVARRPHGGRGGQGPAKKTRRQPPYTAGDFIRGADAPDAA
ncbi:hypothetical protein ACWDG9_33685 [Streptomyces sp. NPDC001073]